MKPEGSLPYSQVPICPYPEPSRSSPCTHVSLPEDPSNIILPSTPGSPKWSPSLRFPHQNPCIRLFSPHTCYMSRPSRWSRFKHPNSIVSSLSSSLCSFLHSPVTSSLLGPNILLSTLFSNTLTLRYSFNASDQVLHPYRTTGKIIILYILILKFLDSKLEDKRFCTEW